MLEGLWYGIAAAFIFIGVVATCVFVIYRVFSYGNNTPCVVVIPAGISDDDIGSLLYCVHMRFSLMGNCPGDRILIVDNGMTQSQRALCHSIMSSFNNMELCAPDELLQSIIGKD